MPYTRRSTWPDERDDYVIRCEGLDVGRVYLTRAPAGDRWLWTIFMNGHVRTSCTIMTSTCAESNRAPSKNGMILAVMRTPLADR